MAKDDGYGMGDVHWGGVNRNPPSCTVDYWPDVSELDDDEKFPTEYKHKDGSTAYVFSSTVAKTVERHFRWMKESGIDGVFPMQRFDDYVHTIKAAISTIARPARALSHAQKAGPICNGRAVCRDVRHCTSTCGGVDVVKG